MYCEHCKQETKFNDQQNFNRWHLKKEHNISFNDYYDGYFREENEGVCYCGKETKFKGAVGYQEFCSQKCLINSPKIKQKVKESREKTNLQKFGVKSIFEAEFFQKKSNKTKLEKYGDAGFTNSNKTKNTKLERYGVDNYNNVEKSKKTCLERYGVDSYNKTKEGRERLRKLFNKNRKVRIKKWKENYYSKSEEVKKEIYEKISNSLKNISEEVREKILKKSNKTKLEKYGDANYTNREKSLKTFYENKINKLKNLSEKIDVLGLDKTNVFGFCYECEKEFKINKQRFYLRNKNMLDICTNCNPIKEFVSDQEKEVVKFIQSVYMKEIIENDRIQIDPLELDVYLPQLKLAFEFNGLYWHSEVYKPDYYHWFKTEECEKRGVHLVHIYEDDWIYKQDIVKSRIVNLLGESNKIYARKCQIKEVDNKECRIFLENNHLQGYVNSKIRLGLYYNDELVSLMTFGGLRRNLGFINTKKDEFELLRFCNKINTAVLGGANRLFKYFINSNVVGNIISYADRSWTPTYKKSLYDNLGFDFISKTKSNYHYIVDGLRENRFKYRKDVLIKEGYDSNKTEHEIMLERSIFRIYDSGQIKYAFLIDA